MMLRSQRSTLWHAFWQLLAAWNRECLAHVFLHVLVAAQNKGGGQNLGTIATVIGGLIGVAVLAYVGLSL
jgi:hypothetical protein